MGQTSSSIVVACDGSDQSANAAALAADLASATGQSLRLLSVFPSTQAERMAIRGVQPESIEANEEQYGQEMFDVARKALKDKVEPTEEVLLVGEPASEILKYMENHPDTHLFLGRRGHSLVRSLTLGSISEKVIRHATGPVTVVSE
ncbi:nucleotide-binding universal stress UspA family protein [Tamilnaduibacter salinus]|uniref:Nucleotide-binding universal stress UspA family protein n=1 Tax=Tamilnaduibacter salinus TaxID=1484056 RepID=A0A2A2I5I3_9GAMM|nr:universal stress protein [Tamilnaduibacter salinus]PAV26842.1 universal stress protein UspA [Tamilnaduibacter salinus]PVY77515.1 nucleotide-binding universal stress UspA family protein [Tamilnaduibacter salinus]